MMKKMQKLLSVILALSMIVCLLSVAVFAADPEGSNDPAPAAEEDTAPASAGDGEAQPVNSYVPAAAPEADNCAWLNDAIDTTYNTIAAAINAASDGDTINVRGTVPWGGDSNAADKTVNITSGTDTQGHIVLNGANGYNDNSANITNLSCGVTFSNIYLEESQGINFIFANGCRLVINSDVTMASNGSVCSGETSGCNTIAVGGSYTGEVASTDMTLNAGAYEYVVGGGMGQNVTGDVNLVTGADCGEVLGGGYRANVGGSTSVTVNGNVGVLGGVYGGSYEGSVGGNTNVTIGSTCTVGSTGYGIVCGGSCGRGSVAGRTSVTVSGDVGSGVYGGNGPTTNEPNPLGAGNNQRYSQKTNEQVVYPAAKTMEKGSIGGDTHVTVNAGGICREAVYGGGADTPVAGSTYVTVNGTVYGEGNAEGVYGGGADVGADVGKDTNVTVGAAANIPMRQVNYSYMGGDTRIGGAVFGGGRFCAVGGDTNVIINGKVGSDGLGGLVFGGGYGIMSTGTATVAGTSRVTINVAPCTYTGDKHLGWQQYTDARLTGNANYNVFWGQSGVFGGGMNSDCDAVSVININADLNGNPVYGDGLYEWIQGKSTINVNAGGVVYKVWGWYDDEQAGDYYKRADGDYARICFNGNTSSAIQLNNLDLVRVTDNSNVLIDNNGQDNQQLVNVRDLTIDNGGGLTLKASAHILGSYTGDKAGKATLTVPAIALKANDSKGRLAADGTVTGATRIVINDSGSVKPAKDQIYVTSGAGSKDTAGNTAVIVWAPSRNGVAMSWKSAGSGKTTEWYLDTGSTPSIPDVPSPETTDIPEENVPTDETPQLNKTDHFGYIIGYPDGTVQPQGKITRAEVATIFYRLLTDESRAKYMSKTNSYSDVPASKWFNNAISTLSNSGVLKGYPDGTFRPNAPITRAEFAAIATRFYAAAGKTFTSDAFTDIAASWARNDVNYASSLGIVSGYPDGTFRPQSNITRAETVKIMNSVLERSPDKDHLLSDMLKWSDNSDVSAWYYAAIQEATNSHDYTAGTAAGYETWTKLNVMRDWAALEK